jgi:hypothetical protein
VERLLRIKERLEHEEQWAMNTVTAVQFLDQKKRLQYDIPDDNDIVWKNLADMLSCSWTTRIWVIQEVAVARETIIQWSSFCFRFEDIAIAWSIMWALGVEVGRGISTHFKSISAEYIKQRNGQQGTLLSLVIRHWLSEATKPHDKIFALCGLASDSGVDGLDINFNYKKNIDEVYTDFARAALKTYRNLDILSALTPFHHQRSQHLPSWVPD